MDEDRPSSVMEKERADAEVNSDNTLKNQYLQGLRLHLLTFGLCLSIFLVNFEISIVSTSLVSITNDLRHFGRSSWIITAYLLTYVAFMVILAKLSDAVGRKMVLMTSVLVFVVFSGICGAAQTITQLTVFRAFQGLGGSGTYSLVTVVMFEMVPPEKFPGYAVLVTSMFAVSLVSGPLVGGAINSDAQWRWVFLLNVPAGVVAMILLFFAMPNNFPHQGKPSVLHKMKARYLDYIGAGSMLVGITLLIVGFEEASTFAPWASARVLVPLIVALVAWSIFIWTERTVTLNKDSPVEPVFPWRFCTSSVIMGIFITAFLTGAIFTSCVIQIPLRFQTVNDESPLRAGIRLIPFGAATPIGGALTAAICGKRRLPPIYVLFPAIIMQILGLVFLSRMTIDQASWNGQYGLQLLTGLGCGLSMGVVTMLTPYVIENRDLATASAAAVQIRVLGGAMVLALVIAVMNNSVKQNLLQVISAKEVNRIFEVVEAIRLLPEPALSQVKSIFFDGYNMQLRILIGFAVAQVPAVLLMWPGRGVRIS